MNNNIAEIKKLIESGEFEKAESALLTALKANPDSSELPDLHADLALKMGSQFWDMGDIDKALEYLTKALEINPSDRNIVLKCGEVLTELDQTEGAEHIYTSYLRENPDDREIISALDKLGKSKLPDKPQESGPSQSILVAVNLVPFKDKGQLERQAESVESITFLKPLDITPLNICYPDELLHPEGWEVAPVLARSADTALKVEGKRKPFVRDLFDAAADWATKHHIEWFIITNSDIIFTPALIKEVRSLLSTGYETIAFSRHDIVSFDTSSGSATGYIEFRGSDVFVCTTSWWNNNRRLFQDYIFGERAWDNAYAATMATHSRFHISFTEKLCFHMKHAETWVTGPYADYNMSLFHGIDGSYAEKFYAFLKEASSMPIAELTPDKTAALYRKYFGPPHASVPGTQHHHISGSSSAGSVSLILPCTDDPVFIKKCVESIKKYTPENHEIIFVPVETPQAPLKQIRKYLKENRNYRLLENAGSLSYPQACNIGINASSGEYVVILSDDAIVTEGWLEGMLEHLNSSPDTGIVGPMTVNVDGPQGLGSGSQGHKGSKEKMQGARGKGRETRFDPRTLESSDPEKINEYAAAFRERNRHRRIETVNLNGFCLLFRRELVQKIGLMDEQLEISDFADNDFCLRAAAEGHRNLIVGDVFVFSGRDRTLAGREVNFAHSLPGISKLFFGKWNSMDSASPIGKKMFVLNVLTSAREIWQKGQKDAAVRLLDESRKIAPGHKKIYYLMSEIFLEGAEFEDAWRVLEEMPEALEADAERSILMGYCKAMLNEFGEAEHLLR